MPRREDFSLEPGAEPQVNRRQVLRTGAWAAPVIILATASPARAVSAQPQPKPDFYFTNTGGNKVYHTVLLTSPPWFYQAFDGIDIQSDPGLQYFDAPATTITSMTLIVTVPAAGMTTAAPTIVNSPGWTVGTATVVGPNVVYTFVWAGTINSASANRYAPIEAVLHGDGQNLDLAGFPKSVTAAVSSPGANPASGTGVVS